MQVGGIERWLLDVAARIDPERVRLAFACRTICDDNRDRLRSLGCDVHVVPDLLHPYRGLAALRSLTARYGPYDAVHSHLHHMTGLVLWMARWSSIGVRIAHSHLDSKPAELRAGRRFLARNAALASMIRRYATAGLACSEAAAASLYGAAWRRDARWRLLFYGIDLAPFRGACDRAATRLDLGIPADAFVVGNIGRFAAQKNHAFFVEVAAEIVRRETSARFLLVGDGPLRDGIERQIAGAGLTSRFHIVSGRTDAAALTRAMDVFLFPSVYEGLGIVLLEAQASGLPCVLTDSLPFEVNVVPPLLQRVSLTSPPAMWAEAVLAARAAAIDRSGALRVVERSSFNIDESCRLLGAFYEEQAGSRASMLLAADAAS